MLNKPMNLTFSVWNEITTIIILFKQPNDGLLVAWVEIYLFDETVAWKSHDPGLPFSPKLAPSEKHFILQSTTISCHWWLINIPLHRCSPFMIGLGPLHSHLQFRSNCGSLVAVEVDIPPMAILPDSDRRRTSPRTWQSLCSNEQEHLKPFQNGSSWCGVTTNASGDACGDCGAPKSSRV